MTLLQTLKIPVLQIFVLAILRFTSMSGYVSLQMDQEAG